MYLYSHSTGLVGGRAGGHASTLLPRTAGRRPFVHRVACRSEPDGRAEADHSGQRQQADGSATPRPNPQQLRLQKVEKLSDEVWAGVAAVDRGEKDSDTSLGKTALLVGGDLAALLIFIAIGRSNHGESLDIASVVKTAAPFLIGWFGAADLQKAYGKEAQGGDVGAAVKKAAAVWATGIPVGLFVRTAQKGYLPDKAFVIVTLVTTFIFLVGWRAALAAVTPKQETAKTGASRRRDRQGNPFEFLQLLASLTKRW